MERFFPGIAKGMLHHVCQPAAKGSNRCEGMGHGSEGETFSMLGPWAPANGDLLGSCPGVARVLPGRNPIMPGVEGSHNRRRASGKIRSAATTTLLGLALVFLSWRLVVAEPLQVGKDPCLRHLSLEPAQGRFDPFVFADGDLSHKGGQNHKQLTKLAKAPPLPRA